MRRRHDFEFNDTPERTRLENDSQPTRNSIHSVSVFAVFIVISCLLFLLTLVTYIDGLLPTPLTLQDERKYPDAFIASRAHHTLKILTDLGPKVAGSYENEVLTVDFLQREISFITQSAHKNQQIELDLQLATGAYFLADGKTGKIAAYSNLQNVVVKLHGANSNHSLLVNAHFDSVPTSPGGSDDGINVAVMLEVLRKLSRKPQRLTHNVVFLFNGAEETGLQAAHGFISQHKWAKQCTTVINLEACGSGGKIILFQTGPDTPWIMKYYNQVPYPYGQVAGEEIFQSGIVPSDTDFRIFRDFGGLIGMDMAFYKNGYRYHTKFDALQYIPLGSIQSVGDNVLSLVTNIGNAVELPKAKEIKGKPVYFDVFGLFMVSYTGSMAKIINLTVVLLSVLIFAICIIKFKLAYNWENSKFILFSFATIIGGWMLSFASIVSLAFVIDKMGYSMSWYRHTWIILGLYMLPGAALTSVLIPFIRFNRVSENVKAQIHAHSVRLIWTGILFLGTLLNIRAMYALMIPVLFNIIGFAIIYICKLQHSIRLWIFIYLFSLLFPSALLMYTGKITLDLFIPISGRIGSDKPTEVLIAVMALFFTILITSPLVALTGLVRNFKYLLFIVGAVLFVNVIIVLSPLGFPYSGDEAHPTPQRQWILHSRRIFHNESGVEIKRDSGYFMLNMDRNSPTSLKNIVPEMNKLKSLDEDCHNFLLCGLPLAHSKMIQILQFSTWIPASLPILPSQTVFKLLSITTLSPSLLQYNVSILGPDRMGVYLSPKKNYKITNISLTDQIPSEPTKWNGRDLFFLFHIFGKTEAPFEFSFIVEKPNSSANDNKTVEIAVTGIYVHTSLHRNHPHYEQFLKTFPKWTDITAWLGSFESWWI